MISWFIFHFNVCVCRKAVKRLATRGAVTAEQKVEVSAFRDECEDLDDEIVDNLRDWVRSFMDTVKPIIVVTGLG